MRRLGPSGTALQAGLSMLRRVRRSSICAAASVLGLLAALPALSGAATPSSIPVYPGNPYYPLVKASSEPQVPYGTKVGGCVLKPRSSCHGANLSGQQLPGASLGYSRLSGASLRGASLAQASAPYLRLGGADLREANLVGSSLGYAQMRKADLSGATITFSGLTNVDLRGAKLVGADGYFGAIIGADMRGADMRRMVFSNSDINGTDMRGANMRGMSISWKPSRPLKLRATWPTNRISGVESW